MMAAAAHAPPANSPSSSPPTSPTSASARSPRAACRRRWPTPPGSSTWSASPVCRLGGCRAGGGPRPRLARPRSRTGSTSSGTGRSCSLAGALLFRYRPAHYYLLRNACLISGAAGPGHLRAVPGRATAPGGLGASSTPSRTTPAGYRTVAAAVAGQRVRGDAELPRRLERPARHRRLPRQPLLAPARLRGPRCRRRWCSRSSRPPTTSSLDVFAGTAIVLVTLLVRERASRRRRPLHWTSMTADRHDRCDRARRAHGAFVIAHRAGNDLERLRRAAAARHRRRRG